MCVCGVVTLCLRSSEVLCISAQLAIREVLHIALQAACMRYGGSLMQWYHGMAGNTLSELLSSASSELAVSGQLSSTLLSQHNIVEYSISSHISSSAVGQRTALAAAT